MSVEDINRFTKDDVVCALEMFNEDSVSYTHLECIRDSDKANGTNWREGNGRPKGSGTAQARVYEWRQQHPEAVSYTHLDVYKRQTRRDARPTVTGKLALIRKPSVSGGIARRQR